MSLHGLLSVTIGVPNVEETAAYYTDFGLAPAAGGWFSTADGGPGRFDRPSNRAPGFMRPNRVRPRKLGHTVLGSVDYRATMAFFVDGLGFKVSDRIKDVGAFMRCSTDHHNILVLSAPVNF